MADGCFAATITNILSHMVLGRTCQHTLWLGKYGYSPEVKTKCLTGCLCQMRAVDIQKRGWMGFPNKNKK